MYISQGARHYFLRHVKVMLVFCVVVMSALHVSGDANVVVPMWAVALALVVAMIAGLFVGLWEADQYMARMENE